MNGPYCGRCAEILPCRCLGLARAELAQLRRERARATWERLQEGKVLRALVRELVPREPDSLAMRALRSRRAG